MLRSIIIISIILRCSLSFAEGINILKPNNISDIESSIVCRGCHDRMYDEWMDSMHVNSTPSRDPIVGAFYKYFSENKFDTGKCDSCHSPLSALYPEELEKGSSEIFDEGINCVFCHSVYEKVSDRDKLHGTDYFLLNFLNGYTGPLKAERTKFHDAKYKPIFRSVEFCAGCHQEGEVDFSLNGKTNLLCQECHMPAKRNEKSANTAKNKRKVVYSHSFIGGHTKTLVGKTAKVSGEAELKDSKTLVNIYVVNSTTHAIPTGYPLREMYLKMTGLNETGEAVWSNFKTNPYGEDPQSYFALVLPKGEEVFAHYAKDVKTVKDLRLGPTGTRLLSYIIPSNEIKVLKVKLFYRLLPRTVIKKLKMEESMVPEISVLEETIQVKQ